jgi:hypothetical protein
VAHVRLRLWRRPNEPHQARLVVWLMEAI